ncbi:hypothetical protein NLI96_g9655 [Meripilus lineatus]|uniref:Uncharacterized protein n=1 Tax=Meripilus lineatus TaxID=2056292 RepID=A0AAD5YCQ4_9APHY|nr:hypothetical protein NLI96_g9655 [Physisporinus lineatus]
MRAEGTYDVESAVSDADVDDEDGEDDEKNEFMEAEDEGYGKEQGGGSEEQARGKRLIEQDISLLIYTVSTPTALLAASNVIDRPESDGRDLCSFRPSLTSSRPALIWSKGEQSPNETRHPSPAYSQPSANLTHGPK